MSIEISPHHEHRRPLQSTHRGSATTIPSPIRNRATTASGNPAPVVTILGTNEEWLPEFEVDPAMPGDTGGDLGPHLPLGGHDVIGRAALDEAIAATGYNGSLDALSGSEEQRARILLEYRRRAKLYKRHLVAAPGTIEAFNRLALSQPNFAPVITLLRRAAALSSATGKPLRSPPILIIGPPGIGKSLFARALAQALSTSLTVVNGSTIPDMQSVLGYPPVWKASGPGYVAKCLVNATTSAPLVFLDEIEKIRDVDRSPHPSDKLLTLLDQHTAAQFEDEFLRVAMRAQNMLWLFAANTLDGALSKPFLDRVVVIEVAALSRAERDAVLLAMLVEVAAMFELTMSLENAGVLIPLQDLSLRRAKLAFELAVAQAVEADRRFIRRSDIDMAMRVLGKEHRLTTMGFVTTTGSR